MNEIFIVKMLRIWLWSLLQPAKYLFYYLADQHLAKIYVMYFQTN